MQNFEIVWHEGSPSDCGTWGDTVWTVMGESEEQVRQDFFAGKFLDESDDDVNFDNVTIHHVRPF